VADEARPPLDVVVVAYRSGEVLGQCLSAVSAFAPAGTRIIVADNSPDDPSAAEAVGRTPGAELRPQRGNVGFAAAVNDVLKRTTAEVVLLLNPDIGAITGSFATVADVFARVPDAGGLAVHLAKENGILEHCRHFPVAADFFGTALGGLSPRRGSSDRGPMLDWDHEDERVVESATGALLFLRRAALDDVGPLDERYFMYFEETDWLIRARARGWQLVFTPAIRAVHYGRQSSGSEPETHSLLYLESMYVFVEKQFGRATAALLRLTWIATDGARLAVSVRKPTAYRREVRKRLGVHLGRRAH